MGSGAYPYWKLFPTDPSPKLTQEDVDGLFIILLIFSKS
jgi:hypothetical protein